jgi:hypothetical protein
MHVCFLRGSHGIVVFCEKTSTVKMNCKWLLLFLDYDFLMVYKTGCSHFMVDAFFRLLDAIKNSGIPNQTIDASLFVLQLKWL